MTLQAYIDEIKLSMTGGILELEIPDETIQKIVQSAMREMQRYICSTKIMTVPYQKVIDLKDKHVNAVARVYRADGTTSSSEGQTTDPVQVGLWQLTSNMGNMYNFTDYTYRYAAYNTLQQIGNTLSTDLSFYYDKFTNKIDICSKFCNEDYKVEIIYYDKKITNEKKITAKLNELVYRNGTVYLNLINLNKSEPQTISLEKILSIKQQPKKTTTTFFTNNVVMYKLTGRLAQNYNPREWEEVYTKVDDYTIIKNSNEPEEELIKRILKYGTQCKIITPQHFKEKICNAIEKTLKLYE